MCRVVAYFRVSTEGQGRSGLGLEAQREAVTALCQQRGWESQPGSVMVLDGVRYELAQFHFHTPAEHRLQGRQYPAELHLVHRGPNGELAVFGVLIENGRENAALKPLIPKPAESSWRAAASWGRD